MEKELTIVIPCKNEEENIPRLLEELSLQRIGSTPIILSDAGSTDETIDEAKKVARENNLNLKICKGGLPARGRNKGAAMAKTEYILFVDADVTFTKKFDLHQCLDRIKEGEFDLLSSTPILRGNGNFADKTLFFLNKICTWILKFSHPFAIGAFTLVKTETFKSIGGFNEEVKHTEDWIFSKQIRPKKFLLIPDLITQNNRRFKKFGHFKMIKLFIQNWIHRNNLEYFKKDISYW
jgi:glycosyltransferase involved in cell wall biosynthesis